jgi:hypothetical protein
MIVRRDRWTSEPNNQLPIITLLYITSVINTASRVDSDIRMARARLMGIVLRPVQRKPTDALKLCDVQGLHLIE